MTSCVAPSVALYYLDRRGWSDDLASQPPASASASIAQKRLAGARFLAVEKKGAWAQPDGALWKELRSRSRPVWDDGRLAIFRL